MPDRAFAAHELLRDREAQWKIVGPGGERLGRKHARAKNYLEQKNARISADGSEVTHRKDLIKKSQDPE
jgi:hypothetical protein